MVSDYNYEEARNVCEKIAASFDIPRFYREKAREVEQSRRLYEHHPHVQACVAILQENESYGHGLTHARKVVIDSGAIILIEGTHGVTESFLHRRVLLVHLAGVLHDIKRSSPNHAREGAKEAYSILRRFDLEETERKAISQAIENHEAFQPHQPLDTIFDQLLSDALYDADKFRWGPDNFTEMIWDIIIPRKIPLSTVLDRFTAGLEGIEKIRETFRTVTGREYGPDFIDLGLEIGRQLYAALNTNKR
ncbi:MAG: hypothetical protein JXC33_03760 [Deltaproteobacteria bacterium]|nr:hypothetical protein [Deltaproteobacteria bacterium]